MSYINKAGHVISNTDYDKLKNKALKSRYSQSAEKITPKAKVEKPEEVKK